MFAVVGLLLAFLVFVASKNEESEPPQELRPATPTEHRRRPIDTQGRMRFVSSVAFLVDLREMERSIGSAGMLNASKQETRDKGLEAYKKLLESERWTPSEIRAELSREVKDYVPHKGHADAEEIMQALFARGEDLLDSGPLLDQDTGRDTSSSELSPEEGELRLAAELIAAGRSRTDPEVRRHVDAAAAYGSASRGRLSPEHRGELRRVAELIAGGKDRDHPEVVQHLNAAEAYEAADGKDLSLDQRRELRKAAKLIATGKDRNGPEIRRHVDAAAAYGAASQRDLTPDQRRELREAAKLIAAGKDRNEAEVRRHIDAAATYGIATHRGLYPAERRDLIRAAELMAAGKDRSDPEVRELVEKATARKRAGEQALELDLLRAHFVVRVCDLANEEDRGSAPEQMARARADYERLLLVGGMSEEGLQESLTRRVLRSGVLRSPSRAKRVLKEIFAAKRR